MGVIFGLMLLGNILAIIVCSLLTAINCKQGINSRQGLGMNPFNYVLMPELLSESGKKFRKVTLYLWLLFIVSFICVIVLSSADLPG